MNITSPSKRYFIAGTDTGVGKTRVTGGLLAAARAQGHRVAGMKPVAAGAISIDGRMFSDDALYIARSSGQLTPYELLNPYLLAEPLSPHIAARRAGVQIDVGKIVAAGEVLAAGHELLLMEGSGGWYAPISESATMSQVCLALGARVVLVVGLRLGCLNHALLTMRAITRDGAEFYGWIANHVDAHFAAATENVASLEQLLGRRPLATLAHRADTAGDALELHSAAAKLLAR